MSQEQGKRVTRIWKFTKEGVMIRPKSHDIDDLKSKLDYDPLTGVFTWKFREGKCGAFNTIYAGREAGGFSDGNKQGYLRIRYKGKLIKSHRVAFAFMMGRFPDRDIDHIDGNIQNNAWSNLREVDRVTNSKNQKMYTTNTSGVVGVNYHKGKGKWVAQIGSGVNRKSLGTFSDKFDAICARKLEEFKQGYHENHGRLNNIETKSL